MSVQVLKNEIEDLEKNENKENVEDTKVDKLKYNLYSYFNDYTKKEIDAAINTLNNEDIMYLKEQCSDNFNINNNSIFYDKYTDWILKKIRLVLSNNKNQENQNSNICLTFEKSEGCLNDELYNSKQNEIIKAINEEDIKLNNNVKGKEKRKMGKHAKSVYDFLKCTEEEAEKAISQLNEMHQNIARKIYREKLTAKEKNIFYATITPKLKKFLEIEREKNSNNKENQLTDVEINSDKENVIENNNQESNSDTNINIGKNETHSNNFSKLNLVKILNMDEVFNELSPLEIVTVILSLGLIDGKTFTTDSISKFLDVDKNQVIEATRKGLLLYKQSLNKFVDSAIEAVGSIDHVLTKQISEEKNTKN